MADDKWAKYAAADGQADKWSKYAQPAKELEIPDATKQAQAAVRKPIEKDHPDILRNIVAGPQSAPKWKSMKGEEGVLAEGSPVASKAMLEMGAGGQAGALVKGAGLLPWLMRALATGAGGATGNVAGQAVTKGKVDPKEALHTGEAFAVGEGAGSVAGKVISKVASKVSPLIKINKLLGVTEKEVIPGKMPASLDEFAANPARGATKYGLDEVKLKSMNPLERNAAIMQAKDKSGASLDRVLTDASQLGKKVNIQDIVNETFSEIADQKLLEQAEKRMLQILDKAGVKSLRDLSPMEARTVQRGLDNFAKFANESEAKSFGDIADQLRTGISKETRKVVPESAEFDRDYTDLVRAGNSTQKLAKEYATTVPENKLRKWLIRAAVTAGLGAAGAAGYEGAKHYGATPVP
jgi:hypothetical protein